MQAIRFVVSVSQATIASGNDEKSCVRCVTE
jgi:hypothetical protein